MTSSQHSYHDEVVPDAEDFRRQRSTWRASAALDTELRSQAVLYQQMADKHNYTYQFEWLGVPIIRLPDDIVVLQEIIYAERPDCIVETGVARGGSVLLSASLQHLCGLKPKVLGIDIDIFPHTQQAIVQCPFANSIELLTGDSTSTEVANHVKAFLGGSTKALLVLDSDHSHAHVVRELELLAPLLPRDSLVIVADTLIEELPANYFPDRHWGIGNNPLTALNTFLDSRADFEQALDWCRRAMVTEFRDGIARKVGP